MQNSGLPTWAKTTVHALLNSLRQRDPYTYGHCLRVARNARLLAKAAGLDSEHQEIIEYSSIFHDIGKIGIPDRILLKPSRLNSEEEEIMKLHPVKSVEIIEPLTSATFFEALVPGIKHHHEHMDGGGYPDGLQGNQIPLNARIILIADTFDAITTTRPYRQALSHEIAYKELRRFSGRQFDMQLVKIFLQSHPKWGQLEEDLTEEYIASHFKRAA